MGHFLERHKPSSASSQYYEEMAGDSDCLLYTFFGKTNPPSCLQEADLIEGCVRDEGLQTVWRILQKKLPAQNFERHLRIKYPQRISNTKQAVEQASGIIIKNGKSEVSFPDGQ